MKGKKIFVFIVLALFMLLFSTSAASAKVMWGKTELKVGQIGKITVTKAINLWERDANNKLTFERVLKPGEEYRVYRYDNLHGGQYGLGGGMYITKMPTHIKYETPSKAKLALLEKETNKPKPTKPSEPTKVDNSRSNPAGIGEKLLIETDDWLDGYQKYEIELKQIISGDEAWRIAKAGNMFNDAPDPGMEYVLAKFRIKVLKLENEPFEMYDAKFNAISKNGVKYNDFIFLDGIEPTLSTDLYAGADYEGWTYFMVNKGDQPLAVFNQGWDDEVWFDISD